MQNLSSEFLKQSLFPSNFSDRSEEEPYTDEERRIKGVRLSVPLDKNNSLIVAIGGRAGMMAMMVPVIYIFAGETGNQWFYLLAGFAVAALILAFCLPLMQVLGLDATCSVPTTAVNGENVLVKVSLKRKWGSVLLKRLVPVKWLVIRSNLVSHLGQSSVVRPLIVESVEGESWVFAATAPLKRGIYRFESMELWSSFPFGLLWWGRKIESINNTVDDANKPAKPLITVYPKMEQVEGNFLYKIRASTDSPMGLMSSKNMTHSTSSLVRGLREFAHGDSPRLIHWPSSARTGRLLVREFDAEGLPGFDLLLNMTTPWRSEEQFELAVSVVFSMLHLGFRLGGDPELYLIPNLDIEPSFMTGFMTDMPALPAGLTRSSHLLARVMQMQDRSEFQGVDLRESSQQALITVRPAKQFDDDYDDNDESLLYKVELAVIPRVDRFSNRAAAEVHMPVHEFGTSNRRTGGNPFGRVISTISRLEEVSQL